MKKFYDMLGNEIPEQWLIEFRGFFWGEGSMIINRSWNKIRKKYGYYPSIRIASRIDDYGMIFDLYNKFGGSVLLKVSCDHNGKLVDDKVGEIRSISRPQLHWDVINRATILKICNVLQGTVLDSKKSRELDLFILFVKTVHINGTRRDPLMHSKQEQIYNVYKSKSTNFVFPDIPYLHNRYNQAIDNNVTYISVRSNRNGFIPLNKENNEEVKSKLIIKTADVISRKKQPTLFDDF